MFRSTLVLSLGAAGIMIFKIVTTVLLHDSIESNMWCCLVCALCDIFVTYMLELKAVCDNGTKGAREENACFLK